MRISSWPYHLRLKMSLNVQIHLKPSLEPAKSMRVMTGGAVWCVLPRLIPAGAADEAAEVKLAGGHGKQSKAVLHVVHSGMEI